MVNEKRMSLFTVKVMKNEPFFLFDRFCLSSLSHLTKVYIFNAGLIQLELLQNFLN